MKNKHLNPMKNIFKWAFVALALVGVSCSKSDDNNGGSGSGSGFNSGNFTVGKHFPRKIIDTNAGHRSETIYEISNGKVVKKDNLTYEYDGNLLKSIKYDDGSIRQEFSYSNNRLIKLYHRNEGTFEYTYDNQGRLSKKVRTLRGEKTTTEYEYIGDNTIQTTYEGRSTTTYTFANGNLIKEIGGSQGTVVYEYDNKNNWQYNNNLMATVFSALEEPFDYIASKNNVTKMTINGRTTIIFQYEYNSEDYPTKVTELNLNDRTIERVTEYQY